jgi:hypothetical protein
MFFRLSQFAAHRLTSRPTQISVEEPVKALYAVTCDYALVSADGKPTIVGVFNLIRTVSIPFQWPRFCFASRVEFPAGTGIGIHSLAISINDPSGARLGQVNGQFQIAAPPVASLPAVFDPHMFFDNVVFQAIGRYGISLEIDGVQLATSYLYVEQMAPPSA